MYKVCLVATSGRASPALLSAVEREGVSYCLLDDSQGLTALAEAEEPDAVVVDLVATGPAALPAIMDDCRSLRLPAIAAVGAEQLPDYDSSTGFQDFVLCPPKPGELSARLRQALSRGRDASGKGMVRIGDLAVDPERYEVSLAGKRVVLTYKEYQLLLLLITNPGRVFSRETLLNRIWGYDYYGGTRTVDVHVRRLRSKIEDADHSFVETVWNVGYRFKEKP